MRRMRSGLRTGVDRQLAAYRSLLDYNMLCYNAVYSEFSARFNALAGLVAVIAIYGTIRAHGVVSFYVYILFPTSAFLTILCLTALNAQISVMDRKSKQFMAVMRSDLLCGHDMKRKEKLKRLAAMKSLRSKNSSFGCMTLRVPVAITEQVINAVLLLLSL